MKPCRVCQHQVSERAFLCPSCGEPFPGRVPLSAGRQQALLAVGLLLAVGADYYTYELLNFYRGTTSGASQHLPAMDFLHRFGPLFLALAPLVVLGAWQLCPKRAERGMVAAVVGFVLFISLPTFVSSIATSSAFP